jgi:hypothetical protein
VDNPWLSCKDIKEHNWDSWNKNYTIDPDWPWWNAPFSVYCDMSTDWWGWTLALNITQDIQESDLYNTEIWTPSLSSNYMVWIKKLVLDNNTKIKFSCQKYDSSWYSFYHRNISDFSSYLIVSWVYWGTIECAEDLNFSSNIWTTSNNCLYDWGTSEHRYYGLPSIPWLAVGWWNYPVCASPRLLRHCAGEWHWNWTPWHDARIWIK